MEAAFTPLIWGVSILIEAQVVVPVTVHFWLVLGASIEMISAVVLTRAVNVPINNQLMTWSTATPPANLRELWEPWEKVHTIRTILSISSFIFQVVAFAIFANPT